ncbi:WD40-repeat-containing domain protein [Phlyctochytrium arcticum]|nr:WD40-repeat-containing domain protein [Phlyctochytrium arcticum]
MNFLRRIVSGVDDDVVGRPHTSFSLASLSRLGLKGDAICVAFDPVQTLLAIGISNGDILLVGKGWEKVLSVPTSSAPPPRYLAFKFGQPYLIAVSTENELSVWDIQTGKVQVEPVSVSSSNVTAVAAPAGGKYVYLGLSNGDVVVYDCTTGIQSPYHITCSLSLEEAAIGGKAVLSVEFNPKDAALLLIGHTAGFSTLWHTTEQVVKKRFRIEQGKNYTPVCTMGWHPEGQHVIAIAGPRIFIWDTKDTWLDGFKRPSAIKPWRSLPLSLDSNLIQVASGAPARRIWHCEKRGGTDEECRIVSTIACGPEEGLETLSWVTLPPLDKIKEDTKLDTGVIVVAPIASFVVVPHIKSTTGGSPAVFSISLMGDINFSTLADGEGVALSLPGSLQLASSPEISDFAASDCSEAFGWDIRNSISKPSTSPSFSNYIQAGTVINKNAKHLWDIFCTLHTDRIVRFWQVGVPVPHHLFDYEITGSPRSDDGRVTLDASQRSFVVVEGHELVLYRWMTAAEVEAALEPEEDMDELMNRLDATVDDVLRQAGDLQALAKAHHGNEPSPTDDDIPPPLLPPRDPSPPPPLPPRDPSPLNSHDSINQDEPLPPYSIDASTAAQQETRVPSYTGNNSTVHISDAELEENVWGDATSSNNTHRVPVVASSSNNDSWDQQSKASGSKTHGDPSSSVSSSSGKQQPSARPPTPSAEPPPLPSGNDEDHSALLDSPTFAAPVRLEYMAPNLVSQKGGWQPILKFHHHGNVTKHALASWTNL